MTSLIDVIFLLLLFFMLSSTFSRFAELELSAATGGAPPASQVRPLFLQLGADDLSLNGREIPLEALGDALRAGADGGDVRPLLISPRAGVSSQRLIDLLVVLRGVPDVAPTVLGDA